MSKFQIVSDPKIIWRASCTDVIAYVCQIWKKCILSKGSDWMHGRMGILTIPQIQVEMEAGAQTKLGADKKADISGHLGNLCNNNDQVH